MNDLAGGRAAADLAELAARLSPEAEVVASAAERAIYARDLAELPPALAGLFHMLPEVVVRPASAQDVAEVMRWAAERGLPVTPRGLASSAYGGAVPARGGLTLDLLGLKRIGLVDETGAGPTVEVGAGVTWGDLDARLARQGFEVHTYPSSRFSTVGGWVNTGGYGINAAGLGHLSRWVEALEVIRPDGSLERLGPDEPGFARCFGSEGQLGVITSVTLRLRRRTQPRPHLAYFDDLESAAAFIQRLLASGPHPEHIKLIDARQMAALNRLHAEAHPGRALAEVKDALLIVFTDEAASQAFVDSAGARLAPRHVASALWHERFFPMQVKRFGPSLLAAQIVLPLKAAARFIGEAARLAERFGVTALTEAYVLGSHEVLAMPMFACDARRPDYLLLLALVQMLTRLGVRRGGRPYAAGLWNGPFARAKFGARYADLLRAKRTLDPGGRLNPGKFPRVRTRFWPADLLFVPVLFRLALDVLLLLASPLGKLAARLGASVGQPAPMPRADGRRPQLLDDAQLEAAIRGCTLCGDCLPVCPAYLVTGDETVIGRQKLRTGLKILQGQAVSREESDKTFLCMYCHACQDVCQSALPLVPMYERIEARLAEQHARPEALIRDFIDLAEALPIFYDFVGASRPVEPAPEIPPGFLAPGESLPEAAPARPETGVHAGLARRSVKYHIDPRPAPGRAAPVGRFDILRADACINCGQCASACVYLVHFRDPLDVRRMAPPDSHLCRNCFRCIQECPRQALDMRLNPEYDRRGSGVFTPDVVASLLRQAERGAIPVFGQGYRGPFAGEGFDGMWTDMSEIVRPTRDGIHGRETISTAVDLGRRLERLEFSAEGRLLSEAPPVLEVPIPLLFARLPQAERRPRATGAVLRAAAELETLAEVEPRDWRPEFQAWVGSAALQLSAPMEVVPETLRAAPLVELESLDLSAFRILRQRFPGALLAARLPFGPEAPGQTLELARAGVVDVIRLCGEDGTALPPGGAPALVEALPQVHAALVQAGLRDRITLVASGGLAMAEHLPKTLILGADAAAVDWPLLIALECRLRAECARGACACGLESLDAEWGRQRLVNLMAAWRNQLLEVLGAMGLREARRLRGERGRAMFARELEAQFFLPLAAPASQNE